MSLVQFQDDSAIRDLILRLVQRETRTGASLPRDEEDLVKTGAVDSMGWVGILSGIEEATGIRNFGAAWPEGLPQSIRALIETFRDARLQSQSPGRAQESQDRGSLDRSVSLTGWGFALGSKIVTAASVDQECGLPGGTMMDRAGIESVARATEGENEIALGTKAAELALEQAGLGPEAIDVLLGTSATSIGFPSFAALLHNRLLLRESCAAVDIGGACVAVIHALATAQRLLDTARRRTALVIASEVNSPMLARPGVPGEFRGLFGDGACAFVLQGGEDHSAKGFRLGDFASGCSGAFSSSLGLTLRDHGELDVVFKGKQLASAAVTTLNQVVGNLEDLSGKRRSQVDCFAFHEPNPRLVEIFAQRAGIPLEKIPRIAHTSGNLGSVTCGVNLCSALTRFDGTPDGTPGRVIFVAAVGQGLLWAGTYLS